MMNSWGVFAIEMEDVIQSIYTKCRSSDGQISLRVIGYLDIEDSCAYPRQISNVTGPCVYHRYHPSGLHISNAYCHA